MANEAVNVVQAALLRDKDKDEQDILSIDDLERVGSKKMTKIARGIANPLDRGKAEEH